jgi:hypothetical protein
MRNNITVLFMAALSKRHVADEIFAKDNNFSKKFFKEFDNLIL